MTNTEPVSLQQRDIQFIVKEKPTRSEFEAIRNKWVILSSPENVCLITQYWAINEPGYRPRLDCLVNTDGPVISVGSSDRVLSLISSLRNPEGGILVELNPYFTEVGIPYYAEAILASEGDPERLNQFFIQNDELLLGLFDLAYEANHNKPAVNANLQHASYNKTDFLQKFRECREQNQRYLGKHSWTQNAERLKKLYELVKAGKIKGYTADVTKPDTWRNAIFALKNMGVDREPGVIDVSNIHMESWSKFVQTNLGNALSQVFTPDSLSPIVLGSGVINARRPPLRVHSPSTDEQTLATYYQNDPVFEPYYRDKRWSGDYPPNQEGLPTAWISRGTWPLVKDAKTPNQQP